MKAIILTLLLLPVFSQAKLITSNIDNQAHSWPPNESAFFASETKGNQYDRLKNFYCITGKNKDLSELELVTYDVYINDNTWSYHYRLMSGISTQGVLKYNNPDIYKVKIKVSASDGRTYQPVLYTKCYFIEAKS